MKALLTELCNVLEQQHNTLDVLLSAAGEHNSAMINNDSTAMMAAVMRLEELSHTLQKQDRQREEIQQRLAGVSGIKGQAVLSDILANATGISMTDRLQRLAGEIKERINRLSEINKMNQVLATRGLQCTSQILNIIMPNESNTYQGSGTFASDRKATSVLNKTI
ncbi:MAG: hypothetical protein VR69_11795 [Peptococcaceae bacterium BRH_c4b]|nr:MAG: hypothetical protein VR69_11795 [Peptococcaceae bacterium BRH_c4b]